MGIIMKNIKFLLVVIALFFGLHIANAQVYVGIGPILSPQPIIIQYAVKPPAFRRRDT